MTPDRPAPALRSKVPWLVAALLTLGLGGAGAYYWRAHSRPSPPAPEVSAPLPPLTASPFLNTRPGVAYVGDQACADCHPDQSKAYGQHPMGRSLFTAAGEPPLAHYDSKANNPFQAGRFHFRVLRQGPRLVHEEWCEDAKGNVVARQEEEIAYVVGSGTQARTGIVQRDGFLFQSPITWYTQKAGWGLSPGYEQNQTHFTRRIDSRCLYCHCQEAHPVAGSLNRYREPAFGQLAIGCERCHGPGALHVAARAAGPPREKVDDTVVNPRHLAPALREAVCEQCHLQGETIVARRGRSQAEYRPGLLHEYVSVFVRPPEVTDPSKIVSHVEQMHLSACFNKSGGRFGCTSCHDPHGVPPPEGKVTFYRDQCLNCHGSPRPTASRERRAEAPECSLPRAERTAKDARDNCLACHMPRGPSSNASHMAVTDHRVPRRLGRPPAARPDPGPGAPTLVAFHRALLPAGDDELARDLGVALIDLASLAEGVGAKPVTDYLSKQALPLLDQAAARAPDDVPALEARGFALFAQGQPDEALRVLEAALAKAPDRELTLTFAARVAQARGRLDLAEKYGRRLAEQYPHVPDHQHRLAVLHAQRKAWPEALRAAQAAVRVGPFRAESRALLITACFETGDRARAAAEFEALGVIHPDYQEKIRPWFAERLRRAK
jgi:predicted CXXCH cytochrome family protein